MPTSLEDFIQTARSVAGAGTEAIRAADTALDINRRIERASSTLGLPPATFLTLFAAVALLGGLAGFLALALSLRRRRA